MEQETSTASYNPHLKKKKKLNYSNEAVTSAFAFSSIFSQYQDVMHVIPTK